MLQKLFFLSCVLCCATASSIAKVSNSSTEDPDLRATDFKAGAGFLIIATFMLMGDYGVGFNEFDGSRSDPGAFEAEVATLKDRMSILDKISYQQGKSFKPPTEQELSVDSPPICSESRGFNNDTGGYRDLVFNALTRSLSFIDAHLYQLNTIEPAFALSALKVVDDKHGGELQKKYPISEWISQICSTFSDNRETESCNALTGLWKSRPGHWKSPEIIKKILSSKKYESVGKDKEVIWGRLNGECQLALLTRCEVPYVCERTLFDPTPRSQYMLTHQLLQRTLAELGTCSSTKDLIDQEVNHHICAKIYKEAQLISKLNAPEILRDLFAEQIGICGYMGYSNFLRQDWLDLILSWQSKSDYGCFIREKRSRIKFMTTDKAVKRLATKSEEKEGLQANEDCLPHFTSVSLTTLATYWDYLNEKCN